MVPEPMTRPRTPYRPAMTVTIWVTTSTGLVAIRRIGYLSLPPIPPLTLGSSTILLQQSLEDVARIGGALAIVEIVEQLAARRPGEEHRHDRSARVVRDLREPVDGFLEAGVEAVHEQQHVPIRRLQAEQAG